MVDYSSAALDVVFRAIADPTRRAMLNRLAAKPRTVGELAEPFEMSLAAASKHVRALERAGLVRRAVQGRTHICSLDARPLRAGMEWMRRYEQFWSDRLDALEERLKAEDSNPPPSRRAPRGPRIRSRETHPRPTPRRKDP